MTLAPIRHGRGDPTVQVDDEGFWKALNTPRGPATIRIDDHHATAWGDGADWLVDRSPGLVGANDDPAAFRPENALLSRLARRFAGMRFTQGWPVADHLISTILTQKVAGKEAARAWRRVVSTLGTAAPGPTDLLVPPPSDVLKRLPYFELHPFGIERRRAEVLQRCAAVASRLEHAGSELEAKLSSIRGVGPWTVAKVKQVMAGDADAVTVGDYHVPNTVAWNLAGEDRADDERMLELLEPYRGHRARVVRLLEASGRPAPKYGPRRALRNIERI